MRQGIGEPRWNRIIVIGVLLVVTVLNLSCDGYVRAQFKIVSADGSALADVLVRRGENQEHDLARFTDTGGCADFEGAWRPSVTCKSMSARAASNRWRLSCPPPLRVSVFSFN